MKTYRRIYPHIYEFENLEWAFRKAREGKRGLSHVAAFEQNLDQELLALRGIYYRLYLLQYSDQAA